MSGRSTPPEPILVRAPNPGTMTLSGTNTWVIPGRSGTVVIDPGPADPGHLRDLARFGEVVAVLLTHRHEDHSAALAAAFGSAAVFAADPRLARGTDPLCEGDSITAGGARVSVLHTPGHTDDSVCFAYAAAGGPVLFTGDTLLGGRNASYVSRFGGSLGAHLGSLERLSGFVGRRGLPGHGPVIADVAVHARAALAHRLGRLAALRETLRGGGEPDPAVLARARHPGRPERWAAAARMIEAELDHLSTV